MTGKSDYVRYALLGAVAGAAALAVLLSMPMMDPPGAPAITATDAGGRQFERFLIKAEDILAVSHDGSADAPLYPTGIRPLPTFESPGNAVITAKLRNTNGEVVGVASRYTAIMTDAAQPESWWTLVLTRRGTVASHCASPAHDHCGAVIGGTDEFAQRHGRLREAAMNGGYVLTLTTAGDDA
jgi:hypothetical protein